MTEPTLTQVETVEGSIFVDITYPPYKDFGSVRVEYVIDGDGLSVMDAQECLLDGTWVDPAGIGVIMKIEALEDHFKLFLDKTLKCVMEGTLSLEKL